MPAIAMMNMTAQHGRQCRGRRQEQRQGCTPLLLLLPAGRPPGALLTFAVDLLRVDDAHGRLEEEDASDQPDDHDGPQRAQHLDPVVPGGGWGGAGRRVMGCKRWWYVEGK